MNAITKAAIRNDSDRRCAAKGYYYDPAAPERYRGFCRNVIRQSKGRWAGKPLELLDWQYEDVIKPVFGWRRPDGTRRFRIVYVEVPKKNGKSCWGAATGLYLLTMDGEGGAEVYSAATKQAQASIIHSEAIEMVKKSPHLSKLLRINASTKVITHETTSSKYAALASDGAGSEGLNWHGLICDEMHVWTDRAFWESLKYGHASRNNWMQPIFTTAGVFDKESIGWQQHDYAAKVLAGEIEDDEYFAYIRCADKGDDILDPKTHAKANPSYGTTIDPAEMLKAAKAADAMPSERNAFMRYRLNMWVEAGDRLFDLNAWDRGICEPDESELRQRPCFVGLDLGATDDLTAAALVWPYKDGYYSRTYYWMPEEAETRRTDEEKRRYREWIEAGWLFVTPGGVTDYSAIRAKLNEWRKSYYIQEIGADRWNSTYLATQLQFDGFTVIVLGQGMGPMTSPTKMLVTMVYNGRWYHQDDPVLRWMAGNAAGESDDEGRLRVVKGKSSGKVDGIVANVMALGRAMIHAESGGAIRPIVVL